MKFNKSITQDQNDYLIKKAIMEIDEDKIDSDRVKNTKSTTAGDVYDVRYINRTIGDIEEALIILRGVEPK